MLSNVSLGIPYSFALSPRYSLAKTPASPFNAPMISVDEFRERMKSPLEKAFDSLARTKQAHRRGFRFQDLLSRIFEEAHFEVHANPGSARPRQSDLFVEYHDANYLIEAKWQKKKITSSDIDSLRARLDRTSGSVIGCLFSMSGYTPEAIAETQLRRQREILLFSHDEIHRLAQGRENILELIKQKKKSLRIHGKVWFSQGLPSKSSNSRPALPASSITLVQQDVIQGCVAINNLDNYDVHFAPEIPDVRWGAFSGSGVGVEIRIPAQSLSDLKNLFGVIHKQLGLTSEGTFSIRQHQCSWHGYGIENFFRQAGKMKARYKKANLTYIHHSEDLHYFDRCSSGFISLTSRQGTGKRNGLHMSRLQLRLPGIPADMKPFLRVFEEAGDPTPYFVPLTEWNSDSVRLPKKIRVEAPVAQIISRHRSDDDASVCGIVVKNPFRNKSLIPASDAKYSPISHLWSPEYLMCNLRDWHPTDSIVDFYYLENIESMYVDQNSVFCCSGTWNAILNSPHGKLADGEIPPPLPSIVPHGKKRR
jgi:hypothetical protein